MIRSTITIFQYTLSILWVTGCLKIEVPNLEIDSDPPSTNRTYAVSTVVFATSNDQPLSNYIRKAPADKKVDTIWTFWLLEDETRKILVDPGFYRDYVKEWYDVDTYQRPDLVLEEIGLAREDITDIVVTHLHASSMDAVDLFPNANVYIQSGTMALADRWVHYGRASSKFVSKEAVEYLGNIETQERLIRLDNSVEPFDGIKVFMNRIHTDFYSYLVVHTNKGNVVIGSDIVPFYMNVEKNKPIAKTSRHRFNKKLYKIMRSFTNHTKYILPRFDPGIKKRFAKRSEHIYWVAQ